LICLLAGKRGITAPFYCGTLLVHCGKYGATQNEPGTQWIEPIGIAATPRPIATRPNATRSIAARLQEYY
jgi:hypothetical protein